MKLEVAMVFVITLISPLLACAPLPSREDGNAFAVVVKGAVAREQTPSFIDCAVDAFNRTANAREHDIKTTQQRRSSGYRIDRRWNLNQMLLIVSVDIGDDGSVSMVENMQLGSIAPFVKTKEEKVAIEACLSAYRPRT